MQNRIEELIEECTHTMTTYKSGIDESWVEFDKQKFAELVIKECAKIADDGFGSAHFGLGISGKMLKDHFGIKE